MDDVRIGIAGLGHRALNWIRLLQAIPGYRITAIYDWIEPLQAARAGPHPRRRRYGGVFRL